MPTLVAIILLALGLIGIVSGAHDFVQHGGIYMRERKSHVAGSTLTVFFIVSYGAMLLAGIYLLMPATTCSPFAMP